MQQEVDLEACGQEQPILEAEVRKQGLAIPNIGDVVNRIDIDVLSKNVHLRLLRGGLASLLGRLLLRLGTLGEERLALRGVLPLILELAPLPKALRPLGRGVLECLAGLDVFDALCELLREDPILQRLSRLLLALPLVNDLVEAFLLCRERELRVRPGERGLCDVRDWPSSEDHLLLLLGELNDDVLLDLLVLLGLGGLLLVRLLAELRLPLLLLDGLLAVLLLLLAGTRGQCRLLLFREHQLMDLLLELRRGLTHDHEGGLFEPPPPLEMALAAIVEEIRPQLRHEELTGGARGEVAEQAANRPVVHRGEAELCIGFVFRWVPTLRHGLAEPALPGPLNDAALADLLDLRMLLQEHLDEVEVPVAW
mmetsp:Transcript_18402/g.53213  ORF Transcript_18402/g.53213 Transcript_18402/m.53213 type:complete len:367 (-) Transcript_18402:907-2007(-)